MTPPAHLRPSGLASLVQDADALLLTAERGGQDRLETEDPVTA